MKLVWALLIVLGAFLFFYLAQVEAASVQTTVQITVCGNDVKETEEHCDNNDLGGRSCSNLGFSGGDLSCSASCQFVVSACTTSAEVTGEQDFTFASGGSHTLENGNNKATITVPEDCHTTDLRFESFSYSNDFFSSSKPGPSGKDFIGKTYDFIFIDTSGATFSTCLQPTTIVLTYTDADISGTDESTLGPYRHDGSSWQLISGATIDTANNKVTFTTTLFSSFALFGEPAASSSSSGGGGGGIALFPTGVSFSGWAYPNQPVTLLKDAQAAGTATAGSDGTFAIAITGLSAGSYVFALYGEDVQGRISNLFALPLRIAGAVITNVSEIIIAPTIDSDKSQVRQGDSIVLSGQSAPTAAITIHIEGEQDFFVQTVSGQDGIYLYDLDTALLKQGSYQARARVSLGGRNVSGLSGPVHFLVGTQSVIKEDVEQICPFGDLNQDCQVNLIDFSILIYWIDRSNPPATVDMDKNGVVNLKDFSIMSFYWTG